MRGRIKRTVLFLFAVLLSAVFWPVVVRGETDKKDIETDIEKTDEGEPLILAAAGQNTGGSVDLTVGREIFYGSYSTNYFDVNGKTAYCLEPLKDTPLWKL